MRSELRVASLRPTKGEARVPALDPLGREARECFQKQAEAIARLADRLEEGAFARAVQTLASIEGHVIVAGMGKSGLVGKKIAATLSSTGTPSFFLHASEALHGDLGAVTDRDAVLLLSYSGETSEVLQLVDHLRHRDIPTIGLVGNVRSTLARRVHVMLDVSVDRELCPHDLVPTNSTLAALAMGDALAVGLTGFRGFQPSDFARFHPGGSLGRRLGTVADAMTCDGLPSVSPDARLSDAVLAMARSRLPVVLVMDDDVLRGIVREETLRARLDDGASVDRPVRDVLDPKPPTVRSDASLQRTEQRMRCEGLDAMVVVDDLGRVAGILSSEV